MEKKKVIIISIIVILAILVILPSPSIAKKIDHDSKFTYSTSITGKYSRSERANIYKTDMDVPNTARYIIKEKRPESYTDLTNEESIQITYDDYYILVYKGEDLQTYVQTSSRKFIHKNGYYGLYRPYRRNIIVFYDRSYRSRRYSNTDSNRYGGGYYKQTPVSKSSNSSKITTDKNSSSKIKTNSNDSSKIRTTSTKPKISTTSGSIRKGSSGSRSSLGGGTSFGK